MKKALTTILLAASLVGCGPSGKHEFIDPKDINKNIGNQIWLFGTPLNVTNQGFVLRTFSGDIKVERKKYFCLPINYRESMQAAVDDIERDHGGIALYGIVADSNKIEGEYIGACNWFGHSKSWDIYKSILDCDM